MKAAGWLLVGRGKLLVGLGKLLVGLGKLLASGKFLVVIATLGALAAGCWLAYLLWQGQPVAAAFTRVGGATHVETALDASRFWTTAPGRVVTVSANANEQTMLAAAQCAMAYDAPLLFRSLDPKQERMVDATIAGWGLNPNGPDVATVGEAKRCLQGKDPADIKGLSAYGLPRLPLPGPNVAPVRDQLAPVVVFAAKWAPTFPPDIAVGLALSAHMARAYGEVSLVVVPRYVEANPALEAQLRNQRDLVESGVILGEQNLLSEDTRALLRQLLTSTNEQAVLAEIQSNLLLIAPLVAALAALFALGMKPEIGEKVVGVGRDVRVTGKQQQIRGWWIVKSIGNKQKGPAVEEHPQPPLEADWLKTLGKDRGREITIWLRDGLKFAGKVDDEHSSGTVLRLTNVNLAELESTRNHTKEAQGSNQNADLLVSFDEIRFISLLPATASNGNQSTETVGSSTAQSPHPTLSASQG